MNTLYERLGGADGISKMVDDIVDAHLNNPVTQSRFVSCLGKPERAAKIKKHTCDFLGAECGGPENYTGRGMMEAHRGMDISETEFLAVVADIMAVLFRHNVEESTRRDVLALAFALKSVILRQ